MSCSQPTHGIFQNNHRCGKQLPQTETLNNSVTLSPSGQFLRPSSKIPLTPAHSLPLDSSFTPPTEACFVPGAC
eukprot:6198346-Pleurochrysis_carterae.AAC.2